MLQTFDKNYMLSHRGCYGRERMENLIIIGGKDILTIYDFLNWDIPLKDKFYFVRNYTDLDLRQKQNLALMCAKFVLSIFEEKYPNDKRVRDCIDATEGYINGTISLDVLLSNRRNAAAAADDAAYAAAAAYAADDVAYAADAADDDAAAAAYDAAAAAAAADKTHTNNLLNALKEFCINNK